MHLLYLFCQERIGSQELEGTDSIGLESLCGLDCVAGVLCAQHKRATLVTLRAERHFVVYTHNRKMHIRLFSLSTVCTTTIDWAVGVRYFGI